MPRFGFVGPGYLGLSPAPDAERSVNLYIERVESGHGKNDWILKGTPGRKLLTTLPSSPVRGLWGGENRLFAVGGSKLYEVFLNKAPNLLGDVGLASTPVSISSNGNELFIVSGAQGYLADGQTVKPVVNAVSGCFLKGVFVAAQPNSNQFNVSDPLDGSTWDPLNFSTKSGSPDRLVAVFADHELLWLMGDKTIEVWADAGLPPPGVPFQEIQGAFIEQGLWAPASVAKIDNSLMWLGGDDRGALMVWRALGFLPQRVSNHAMEARIRQYSNSFDAVGYPYQESGHNFYCLSFPTADATWVFDTASGAWHERGFWDTKYAQYHADIARFHAYTMGIHFVGDYRNGNIYIQSEDIYSDNGSPIRRLRTSPHISNEMNWARHGRLVIDMQVSQGPASGQGSVPTIGMRFSDDGGFTWSNQRQLGGVPLKTGAGQSLAQAGVGEYKYRYVSRRLGRSRDRAYEAVISDPVGVTIVDAYTTLAPGPL
ncbi:MAG TPA: hypothetical protein VKX49_12610 [Bryobacteraceae bacterium]|nr:hypothetical protein [Bryobacteraceae bacterium]